MAYRLAQANFSKGELAPALHGRFDVESYSSAAKKVRNAFVLKYGGLSKRPGTRLVAEVLDAENDVRLIPLQFSLDQSYALEMGQGYIRAAALGGLILNASLKITSISNAGNAKIPTAYHGSKTGHTI